MPEADLDTAGQNRTGLFYAVAAFIWWAGSVFYFKAVEHVSPLEVLAHRVIWTAALLVTGLVLSGRATELTVGFRRRRTTLAIIATTLLIGSNWYVFIWAIAHNRVLDTSLAYYITPLLNVGLGALFLRERFRPLQVVAVAMALVSLSVQGFQFGGLPLISLFLAFSFSIYGLIRKVAATDPVIGATAEMVLLAPAALLFFVHSYRQGALSFTNLGIETDLLLVAAGVVTAVPQIWFLRGAQSLRYASLGMVQFILPSLTFIIAVFVFHEPFSTLQFASFAIVWAAVSLYSVDTWRSHRGSRTS
jgi:chloramphenicol-sensitive protein RarD